MLKFRDYKEAPGHIVFNIVITIIGLLAPLLLFASEPLKLHLDLLSATFATDKDGWACGRWGTILHTTDGGKTWNNQTSGTDYTLTGIHFVDPKHGWAVGDQGTIIHTKDGGATWVKQKSPVPYFLMAVQFVNSKKGWIVTERTTILATEDGGATWQVQFKDQDFILRGLSFCDEQNGWAVGEYGFTYHTDNGGKTWQNQAGEYELSVETMEMKGGNFLFDVIALSPKTAWVAGIDGYVARTEDGGKTWVPVTAGIPKRHLFGVASDKQGTVFIGGDALLLRKTEGTNSFSAGEDRTRHHLWLVLQGRTPRANQDSLPWVRAAGYMSVTRKGAVWQKVTY